MRRRTWLTSAMNCGPQTITPPLCLVSLQSPPKFNEVTSDANRENAAAESASESYSQEATPEKGTAYPVALG
jgi:hypothetical protein